MASRPSDDQSPQVVGGADPAGVAAGHADDRDRLVRDPAPGRGGRGGARRSGPHRCSCVAQVPGQGGRGRVVEDEGGGQPQPGCRVEAVAELDRRQRVETQLLEGPVGVDALCVGVPEDRGHVAAHQVQQELLLLASASPASRSAQRGGRDPAARAPRRGAAGCAPGRAARGGSEPASACGAQRRRCRLASDDGAVVSGPVAAAAPCRTGASAVLRRSEQDASPRGSRRARSRAVQVAGESAGVFPESPGEGGGGESLGVAVVGEGVEEGVGGGVVGLSGVAEGAGDGGVEDERVQVGVRRSVRGGSRRRRPSGRRTVASCSGVRAVSVASSSAAGGVDDGGQRVLRPGSRRGGRRGRRGRRRRRRRG